MLTIDLHTHILPRDWPDMQARTGYPGWIRLEHHEPGRAKMLKGATCFRQIEANCWDPAVRLRECDAQGVDVQVLSTVPVMFSYWARPQDALDLSRLLNDHLAEVVRAHPRRFVGLGTIPLQDPQLACAELERCVRELGLRGVQIGSHVNQWNLDQAELFPVFARAAELGAAVFVHPWDMMGQEQMPKYWLPWLVGMPAETARAICSLIFGGVLERLPGLRVAFAHGGGSWPFTLGRIAHGWQVRPDLCAVDNQRDPREYVGKFWVDALVHDPAALRFLVELVGARRVALGTDYPFPLGEEPAGSTIRAAGFEPQVEALLRGGAALELLDLPASAFAR